MPLNHESGCYIVVVTEHAPSYYITAELRFEPVLREHVKYRDCRVPQVDYDLGII